MFLESAPGLVKSLELTAPPYVYILSIYPSLRSDLPSSFILFSRLSLNTRIISNPAVCASNRKESGIYSQ